MHLLHVPYMYEVCFMRTYNVHVLSTFHALGIARCEITLSLGERLPYKVGSHCCLGTSRAVQALHCNYYIHMYMMKLEVLYFMILSVERVLKKIRTQLGFEPRTF